MPYQLPPELKTNKFNSLPDDLREIAEVALAKKFDLPEVIAKKKTEPKPKQQQKEPLYGNMNTDYPYRERCVEVRIEFRNPYEMNPASMRNGVVHGWTQIYPREIGPYSIIRELERRIRDMYSEVSYQMGRAGDRPEIILEVERRRDRISSHKDIERLVMMAYDEDASRGWRSNEEQMMQSMMKVRF